MDSYSSAIAAICSTPEGLHFDDNLTRRLRRSAAKFLFWTYSSKVSDELIPLSKTSAKAAGTTVESLMRVYPSEWYVVSNEGVWVRFPEEIRYGDDLTELEYLSV